MHFVGVSRLGHFDWIGLCPNDEELQWIDEFQIVIDIVGCYDPTPVFDSINAAIYASRGKWDDAGISLLGIVPYVGDAGKVGKYAVKTRAFFKSTNKKARKQVDDISREFAIKGVDRKKFGKYIEKIKNTTGRGGADNFTWDELKELASEFTTKGRKL